MSVIAYHLVWTAYGTWLPNDPRGSGSRMVASPALAELGVLHYGRKSLQPRPSEVPEFYKKAEPRLIYPVIRFDDSQIERIGEAFAATIGERAYTCYACAILPDHVHLVVRKHRDRAEAMIEQFQTASRLRLCSTGAVSTEHPVWTRGGCRGFLDSPEAARSAVRYIERNPKKAGHAAQSWSFVTPYDGWPRRPKQPPSPDA